MSDNQQEFLNYVDNNVDGFIARITDAVSRQRQVIPRLCSTTDISNYLLV